MTSQYARGVAVEKRVAKNLRGHGYHVVESRGSHGALDLVAIKSGQVVGVQCKRRSPQLPPADRAALWAVAVGAGLTPVVAWGVPDDRDRTVGIGWRQLVGTGAGDWLAWTPDLLAPSGVDPAVLRAAKEAVKGRRPAGGDPDALWLWLSEVEAAITEYERAIEQQAAGRIR